MPFALALQPNRSRSAFFVSSPARGMALHLAAHTLADEARSPILGVNFNSCSSNSFATATKEGWVIYRTQPLEVLSRRGGLASSVAL